MNPIHQRPLRRAWSPQWGSGRAEKFDPTLFDQPSDARLRKGFAQSVRSGQRVNHVAHRAQPHNEQPLDLLTTIRHDQDFLGESRERMISLVEWSFASPTISTRPPFSITTSR